MNFDAGNFFETYVKQGLLFRADTPEDLKLAAAMLSS
jgi:hypothetical protein